MSDERAYNVGIDLGGSHIEAAIADSNGNIISCVSQDVISKTKEQVTAIISHLLQKCLDESKINIEQIKFIGIGVPGSFEGTIIKKLINIGLENFDIGEALRHIVASDVKIMLENDAHCAAIAELALGSLKGVEHAIMLTFGTGVGVRNNYK